MIRNNPTTTLADPPPFISCNPSIDPRFIPGSGLQTSLSSQFQSGHLWRNVLPQFGELERHDSPLRQIMHPELAAPLPMGLDTVPLYNDQSDRVEPTLKQRVILYSDKVVVYMKPIKGCKSSEGANTAMANLSRGRYNGYISQSSAQVIRRRLEAWIKCVTVNRQEFKGSGRPRHSQIVFATLTLPSEQIHDDREIRRKCLAPFFQQLKRIYGVQETFWCAEPQENGNIHFHCLWDRYVDKKQLDDLWNVACNHLGYLDRYVAKTGDVRPPSTKIRVCPKDMSLVKYVLKYVSKQPEIRLSCYPKGHVRRKGSGKRNEFNYQKRVIGQDGKVVCDTLGDHRKVCSISYWEHEVMKDGSWRYYERRPIDGRSWGMSDGLVNLDVFSCDSSYRVHDLITILQMDPDVKLKLMDHAQVYYCNTVNMLLREDLVLFNDYRRYYAQLYRNLYFPQTVSDRDLQKVVQMRIEPPPKVQKFIPVQLRFAC